MAMKSHGFTKILQYNMAAEIKNLKDIANYEYGLKKIFEDAEDFCHCLGPIMWKCM